MKIGTFQPNKRRKNRKHGFFASLKKGIVNRSKSMGLHL